MVGGEEEEGEVEELRRLESPTCDLLSSRREPSLDISSPSDTLIEMWERESFRLTGPV